VLGRFRLVGMSATAGAGAAVPTPVSAAVCTKPAALSVTETPPEKIAADCGEKVTEMVQVAFTASVPPQLFVSVKSVGLAPVMLMADIFSGAVPELESVIVCGEADVVAAVLGRLRLDGMSTAKGAGAGTPVPVS
jgi:hypothetical protein